MKLAVLGGSFNPLHIGHCMLAEAVCTELGYDKVLLVPTGVPPHKIMNTVISPYERFKMVRAFCKSSSSSRFEALDYEVKKQGISYTVETLEYITEKYKNKLTGKPAFIMGQEVAAQFCKWNNPEKVAALADLIIAKRHPDNNGIDTSLFKNTPSGTYTEDYEDESFLENFPYPHTVLQNPVLPVSSTEIRSRIAQKKAWHYLVPESVFLYIMRHNLYGVNK